MAGNIKGIIINIGANTQALQTALKDVNSKSKNLQNELKQVEKLLKLDPANTELLAQKQKLLSESIENTKTKLNALREAQEKVNKAHEANEQWERQYKPIAQAIDETKNKLKALTSQQEEMNQKLANGQISTEQYNAYQQELEETRNKSKQLRQELKDLDAQFADGHIDDTQYRNFQRELISTEQELNNLQTQLNNTNNSWNNASQKLNNVGNTMQNVGQKMGAVGTTMTATVTAPIVGIGTAAVMAGANFEKSMSQVAATMGMTSEEIAAGSEDFKMLEDAAKEAGATTKFSATQAGDALNFLALAGYDAKEAVNTLPQVLDLASAGGLDLAYASDLATDSMSALGLSKDEFTKFGDQLAKTSQKSNTSIGQLGEAILTVGGTAKSLAGGTVELNTSLGILADAGIKGAEGGTALRNIILSLTAPTDKAAKFIKDFGLQVYDADGKMRPLNETFKDLNAKLSNLTEAQQAVIKNEIFNKVDLKSVEAMLDNCGNRFDELSNCVLNADGTMHNMAITMSDNLSGKIDALKSALEGVAIQIYEILLPKLTSLVNKIQEGVNWFANLDTKTQSIIVQIAAFAAAIGPLLLGFGKITEKVGSIISLMGSLAGKIGAVGGVTKALGTAIGALTGPIGLTIAAVTTLVAGFVYLWNTNEDFKNAVIEIWNQIKEFLSSIFGEIKEIAMIVFNALKEFWDTWGEDIKAFFNVFLEFIKMKFDIAFKSIKAVVETVIGSIKITVETYINLIKNAINTAFSAIASIINAISAAMSGDWASAWEYMKQAVETIGEGIKNTIGIILNAIGKEFSLLKDKAIEWGKNIIIGLVDGISSMLGNIKEAVTNVAGNIVSTFTKKLGIHSPSKVTTELGEHTGQGFANGISNKVNDVKEATQKLADVWNSFIETCKEKWNNVKTFFTDGFKNAIANIKKWLEDIKDNINNAWTKIKESYSQMWNDIKAFFTQAFKNAITNISTWLNTILTNFVTWFIDLKTKASEKLTELKNLFFEKFESIKTDISNWFTNLIDIATTKIPEFIGEIKSKLEEFVESIPEIGRNIVEGIADGITEKTQWLTTQIKEFGEGILEAIKNALGIHSPSKRAAQEIGKPITQGIGVGFKDNLKSIYNEMQKELNIATSKLAVNTELNLKASMNSNTNKNNDIGTLSLQPISAPSCNITVQNMYVREESDIDKVGQKLNKLFIQSLRGRGAY